MLLGPLERRKTDLFGKEFRPARRAGSQPQNPPSKSCRRNAHRSGPAARRLSPQINASARKRYFGEKTCAPAPTPPRRPCAVCIVTIRRAKPPSAVMAPSIDFLQCRRSPRPAIPHMAKLYERPRTRTRQNAAQNSAASGRRGNRGLFGSRSPARRRSSRWRLS